MNRIFFLLLTTSIILSLSAFSQNTSVSPTTPTTAQIDSDPDQVSDTTAPALEDMTYSADSALTAYIDARIDAALAKKGFITKRDGDARYVNMPGTVKTRDGNPTIAERILQQVEDIDALATRHDIDLADFALITINTRDSLRAFNSQHNAARREDRAEMGFIKARLSDVEIVSIKKDDLDDQYGRSGVDHQKAARARIMDRIANWALQIRLARE